MKQDLHVNRSSRRVRMLALLCCSALAALLMAGGASAVIASWGYNWMGSGVNSANVGYNYWVAEWFDKQAPGGYWDTGWRTTAGVACRLETLPGGASGWIYPSQFGCGGYIDGDGKYQAGSASYVYMQFNT